MKKRIKEKLNSQKGASITFALLLFLVCAVISSIVIAAGSAAAGRMSGLARMDRRYYAVTSAAELLVDQIDGKTVSVVSNKEDGKIEDSGEEASIIRDASEQLVSAYASGASGSDIVRTRKFKLTSGAAINNAALSCLIEEKKRNQVILRRCVLQVIPYAIFIVLHAGKRLTLRMTRKRERESRHV